MFFYQNPKLPQGLSGARGMIGSAFEDRARGHSRSRQKEDRPIVQFAKLAKEPLPILKQVSHRIPKASS
jgi:hypothetical protein